MNDYKPSWVMLGVAALVYDCMKKQTPEATGCDDGPVIKRIIWWGAMETALEQRECYSQKDVAHDLVAGVAPMTLERVEEEQLECYEDERWEEDQHSPDYYIIESIKDHFGIHNKPQQVGPR